MIKIEHQILEIETIIGKREIKAPADWEFDKTSIIVWSKLLRLQQRIQLGFKRKMDSYANEEKINCLANVLANSLGMSSFYWIEKSKEYK